jgi:hypothetical protein
VSQRRACLPGLQSIDFKSRKAEYLGGVPVCKMMNEQHTTEPLVEARVPKPRAAQPPHPAQCSPRASLKARTGALTPVAQVAAPKAVKLPLRPSEPHLLPHCAFEVLERHLCTLNVSVAVP